MRVTQGAPIENRYLFYEFDIDFALASPVKLMIPLNV